MDSHVVPFILTVMLSLLHGQSRCPFHPDSHVVPFSWTVTLSLLRSQSFSSFYLDCHIIHSNWTVTLSLLHGLQHCSIYMDSHIVAFTWTVTMSLLPGQSYFPFYMEQNHLQVAIVDMGGEIALRVGWTYLLHGQSFASGYSWYGRGGYVEGGVHLSFRCKPPFQITWYNPCI